MKVKWNQNTNLFIHENTFENIVCEMTAILSSGGHELWGILLIKISQDKCMYRKSHQRFLCNVTTKFCHKFGNASNHDDVTKWKHFPRHWPFVREIHRSPVNFPHKGQWRGALMFPLICSWINGWVNNREAGDSRRHRVHYDVIVMLFYVDEIDDLISMCKFRQSLSWLNVGARNMIEIT